MKILFEENLLKSWDARQFKLSMKEEQNMINEEELEKKDLGGFTPN